jgi:hypothetical protein
METAFCISSTHSFGSNEVSLFGLQSYSQYEF